MASAPPLKGYARFTAKPSSDVILNVDPDKKDPLYVRWQYGLGRAAVFTSDAKSRWAEAWVSWPGFDKFWINVTRDLLAHTDASEASARYNSADTSVEVSYRIPSGSPEPRSIPQIFIMGPNGFEKNIPVTKSAPRMFTQGLCGRANFAACTGSGPLQTILRFPKSVCTGPKKSFRNTARTRSCFGRLRASRAGASIRRRPPSSKPEGAPSTNRFSSGLLCWLGGCADDRRTRGSQVERFDIAFPPHLTLETSVCMRRLETSCRSLPGSPGIDTLLIGNSYRPRSKFSSPPRTHSAMAF